MNASNFTKTDTTMNKLQNVSGAGRKPDQRLIKLSDVNVSLGLNQHQSTSRLDRSQSINASEIPKTKTTISLLQNVSRIGRQPEERSEITSNMNMLHRGNQFESAFGNVKAQQHYQSLHMTYKRDIKHEDIEYEHKGHKHNKKQSEQLLNTTEIQEEMCNQGNLNRTIKEQENVMEINQDVKGIRQFESISRNRETCKQCKTTPLHISSSRGYSCIVKDLIAKGADVNICDDEGQRPLDLACFSEHTDIVNILLKHGADVNSTSSLCMMCEFGNAEIVQLLLQNGADVNLCTDEGLSPLFFACFSEHTEIVNILLKHGADVNISSSLCMTCKLGNDEIVQILLNHGADVNLCTDEGLSPLYFACYNEHINIIILLLRADADVTLSSPLCKTCELGNYEIVQILLIHGAEVNVCTDKGLSPIYFACYNEHINIIKLLLRSGADITLFNLFCKVCELGNSEIVQMLLEHGAEVNLCTNEGLSPLYFACFNNHVEIVKILLNHGADFNISRPLCMMCKFGNAEIVRLLLKHGADVNLCTNELQGQSPLYFACFNNHIEIVNILLNHGADVNISRLLCMMCTFGNAEIVQMLLEHGAEVNLCTNEGLSPLYFACFNNHVEIVKILLNHGADVNISHPLCMMCKFGNAEIVRLLLKQGADVNLCNCGWTKTFIFSLLQ